MWKKLATALTVIVGLGSIAGAQSFPSKPIRFVVGFAPGGGADVFARLVAEKVAGRLGVSVVVDNRPGASGTIGATTVARAAPDGHTLLVGTQGSLAVAPFMQAPQPYDPLSDLVPVSLLLTSQLQLYVRDDFPAKTFREFVELVKAAPGTYAYATAGTAGPGHMFAELLSKRLGLKMTHVPYPGDGRASGDVLGGRVPIWATAFASAKGHIGPGGVRPIVTSGLERVRHLPDIPTTRDEGFGPTNVYYYIALMAPKGTPESVIKILNEALVEVYKDKTTLDRIQDLGQTPITTSPEKTADFLLADVNQWKELLKEVDIK